MAETMNMGLFTIEQFVDNIKEKLEEENYDPILGLGKPGVGKTTCIHSLCDKLGIGYAEVRLVSLTETDVIGIPTIIDEKTTYASNTLFPYVDRDGEKGVLVLDEITSCQPSLRAAALQLMDRSRGIGNYKLPDRWLVVALGNGMDDGGVFVGLEGTTINRCASLRIEPNFETWKEWALNNNINSSITAFLSNSPEYIHKMKEDDVGGQFPSPRSWEALSKRLNAREKILGGLIPRNKVELLAMQHIGAELAPKFAVFYEFNKQLIDINTVLNGKANASVINNAGTEVRFLLVEGIIQRLNSLVTNAELENKGFSSVIPTFANVLNFFIDAYEYSRDFSLMAMTDISKIQILCEIYLDLDYQDQLDSLCPKLNDFIAQVGVTFAINDNIL